MGYLPGSVCNCGFGGERFIEEGNTVVCSICGGEVKPAPAEGELWASEAKKKILFVDDQVFYQNVVKDILTKKNLFVEIAVSGIECVQCVTEDLKKRIVTGKQNHEAVLSLVILDLGMPGLLDGVQTLGVIKTIQPSLNVIIFTSSPPEKQLLAQLKALKANHYLKKTNENLEVNLVNSVRKLVS